MLIIRDNVIIDITLTK